MPTKHLCDAVCLIATLLGVTAAQSAPQINPSEVAGSYGVAVEQGCPQPVGLATVSQVGSAFVGRNECGSPSPMTISQDGSITLGGLSGSYDGNLDVIFFDNGSEWIKRDGKLALEVLGEYRFFIRPYCHDRYWPARVTIAPNGRLDARNECNQPTRLLITSNGRLEALDWKSILGEDVFDSRWGRSISWSNGTVWFERHP